MFYPCRPWAHSWRSWSQTFLGLHPYTEPGVLNERWKQQLLYLCLCNIQRSRRSQCSLIRSLHPWDKPLAGVSLKPRLVSGIFPNGDWCTVYSVSGQKTYGWMHLYVFIVLNIGIFETAECSWVYAARGLQRSLCLSPRQRRWNLWLTLHPHAFSRAWTSPANSAQTSKEPLLSSPQPLMTKRENNWINPHSRDGRRSL